MEIDKQLYAEIKEYCELNGLKPRDFANNLLKKAFMEEKYGKMPAVLRNGARKTCDEKKIIEVPKELRHKFEENAEKAIATPQNEENPVKNETIEEKTSSFEENQPTVTVSEEKKTEEKKTIKKRKL